MGASFEARAKIDFGLGGGDMVKLRFWRLILGAKMSDFGSGRSIRPAFGLERSDLGSERSERPILGFERPHFGFEACFGI